MDYYPPMLPNEYYHVYNKGNAYEKLFYKDENYRYFLAKCEYYIPKIGTLYAYALLPNHFHFLIYTNKLIETEFQKPEEQSKLISKALSNLFNSYTKSFNQYHHRSGSLFLKNCKRVHIQTEMQLKNTVLYIHRNATHHNYCKQFDDWPYISHHEIINNPSEEKNCEVLRWFGGLDNYMMKVNKIFVTNGDSSYID